MVKNVACVLLSIGQDKLSKAYYMTFALLKETRKSGLLLTMRRGKGS